MYNLDRVSGCNRVKRKDNGSMGSLFQNHPGNVRKGADVVFAVLAEERNMFAHSSAHDKKARGGEAAPAPGAVDTR